MALDEGKMGKKDSDRAEGQYKMQKNQEDPQLARQQAIDQAQTAGILGNTALVSGGAFASLTGTGDISSGFDDTNIYGGLLGNEAGEMNGGFGFGRSELWTGRRRHWLGHHRHRPLPHDRPPLGHWLGVWSRRWSRWHARPHGGSADRVDRPAERAGAISIKAIIRQATSKRNQSKIPVLLREKQLLAEAGAGRHRDRPVLHLTGPTATSRRRTAPVSTQRSPTASPTSSTASSSPKPKGGYGGVLAGQLSVRVRRKMIVRP